MCEPITITAITTAAVTAAEVAATAATAVGSAITTATTAVGSFLGIGGGGLSSGLGGAVGGGVSTGATGSTALTIGSATLPQAGSLLTSGLSVVAPVQSGITLLEGLTIATFIGGATSGIVQGVQAEEARVAANKANKQDAASKKVSALNARQQGAEAAAKQQFQASRAALSAAGKIKASRLGDRSVAALSRAVGFELGTDKATIKRNQDIANLETSARLYGIDAARDRRRALIGETGGLTLGLNTGTSLITAGANALTIRNALSN